MNNTGFSKRIEITPILGWLLSDDELAIRVCSLLRWKTVIILSTLKLRRDTLPSRDRSNSPSDRDAAEQIIRKLSGVVGVTNRITTLSPRFRRLQRTSA